MSQAPFLIASNLSNYQYEMLFVFWIYHIKPLESYLKRRTSVDEQLNFWLSFIWPK